MSTSVSTNSNYESSCMPIIHSNDTAAEAAILSHSLVRTLLDGVQKCNSNLPTTQCNSFAHQVHQAMRKSTARKGTLGARCDYIGSSTNLVMEKQAKAEEHPHVSRDVRISLVAEAIMVASTTLMLFAGRFGLAPSASRKSTAGLKLVDRESGLQTGDPAGFTATDTLACGAMGHVIGVGIVLGLKATGAL